MDAIGHNGNRTKQGGKQSLYDWFTLGQKELEGLSVIQVEWIDKLYQGRMELVRNLGKKTGSKKKGR